MPNGGHYLQTYWTDFHDVCCRGDFFFTSIQCNCTLREARYELYLRNDLLYKKCKIAYRIECLRILLCCLNIVNIYTLKRNNHLENFCISIIHPYICLPFLPSFLPSFLPFSFFLSCILSFSCFLQPSFKQTPRMKCQQNVWRTSNTYRYWPVKTSFLSLVFCRCKMASHRECAKSYF
jgi:hypothetical protein